jgi:hypothetical protein
MLATARYRNQTYQLYRTSLESSEFDNTFDAAIENVFLRQVDDLLHQNG